MSFSVQELADRVSGRVDGDPAVMIRGVAPVLSAGPGDVTYVMGARYLRHLDECEAAAVLVAPDADIATNGKTLIRVEMPEYAFAKLIEVFHPRREFPEAVHSTAVLGTGVSLGDGVCVGPYVVIDQDASIGPRSVIGAHSYIGPGVVLGADCRIDPNCSLMEGAVLGDRVRVRCGARVSSDGFGFTGGPTGPVKLQQIGRCVLGDDVEVGANSTVDRGALEDTIIGAGTKIDNLVHIGHNCRLGRNCFIVAQVGIAGSTVLGDGVRVGGQAGISGHLTVGDGASIAAGGGIMSNIAPGEAWSGRPARPHRQWLRASSAFYKLPDILRRLRALETAEEDTDDGEA